MSDAMQLQVAALVPGEDGGTNIVLAAAGGTTKKRAVKIGIRVGFGADRLRPFGWEHGGDRGRLWAGQWHRVTLGKPGAAAEDRN